MVPFIQPYKDIVSPRLENVIQAGTPFSGKDAARWLEEKRLATRTMAGKQDGREAVTNENFLIGKEAFLWDVLWHSKSWEDQWAQIQAPFSRLVIKAQAIA